MSTLQNQKWKEFTINELFKVSGTTTTHPSKLIKGGFVPRITCSSTKNGLDNVYSNQATERGGILTVDSATIGYITYQEKDFIATDHVEKIFIEDKRINRNLGLGLTTFIRNSTLNKFNYGYKFSQERIKKQKVIIPINKEEKPHYEFIENYTKSLINKKLENYKKYSKKVLANLEYKKVEPLENKEWEEFFLTDIFSTIQRGRRLTKLNQKMGNIPYVSSTSMNNGVDNFIGNKTNVRIFSDCLTIANSGSVGASFYQPYKFVGSDHITHLKKENMSKYVYMFISTLTNRFSEKYNFNREINDARISREKIMLPVNKKNQPDFEYMEQYMKNITYKKINQYLNYLQKQNIEK